MKSSLIPFFILRRNVVKTCGKLKKFYVTFVVRSIGFSFIENSKERKFRGISDCYIPFNSNKKKSDNIFSSTHRLKRNFLYVFHKG